MIKTVIYGATLTALGAAMRNPGETLILEPTGLVASEFADALRFDYGHLPQTPPGRKLLAELIARKAADETGRAHIPAVAPVVLTLVKEYGVQILFHTALLNRRESSGGVELEVLSVNQRRVLKAARFIDTTNDIARIDALGGLLDVRFNALLGRETPVKPFEQGVFCASPTFYDDCALLSVRTSASERFDARRAAMLKFMSGLPKELEGCRLLSTASTLCVTTRPCRERLSERSLFDPSCGRADYLEALDYGFETGGDAA